MPEVETVAGSEGPVVVDPSTAFVAKGSGKGPFYLWTRFGTARDVNSGHVTKWLLEGTKVTAKDLNLTDDEFQDMIDTGAVRETEWPVPPEHSNLSPNEWYKRQLAVAAGEEVV